MDTLFKEVYCRECGLFCDSLLSKKLHDAKVHAGFAQLPVILSNPEFRMISTWSTSRWIQTCPVCFKHFKGRLSHLVKHLVFAHPVKNPLFPAHQTRAHVIEHWHATVSKSKKHKDRYMEILRRLAIIDKAKRCPFCPDSFSGLAPCFQHIYNHHLRRHGDHQIYQSWASSVEEMYPGELQKMSDLVSCDGEPTEPRFPSKFHNFS